MQTVSSHLSSFITHLSAFDPQALVLALQKGFLEHVQLQKGQFGGRIAHSVSPSCRTDWGQYNLALMAQGDLSSEWLTIGIFLGGDGAWHVQGKPLGNGDMVLYTAGCEMCIRLPAHARWLSVQVPHYKMEMLGLRLPSGLSALHLPGQLSPMTAQVLVDVAAVLGPQREGTPTPRQSEQAHEQLLPAIWMEIARRWHQPTSQAAASYQSRQRLMQSVYQWCEDHSASPLRIDALCQALDVPIWQLERAFQETCGMPPQRLLTLQRLTRARHDLLTRSHAVTDVAMRHGFWHLGRFARLYKDYFGESPSKTAHLATKGGLPALPGRP